MVTVILTRPNAASEQFAKTLRKEISQPFDVVISPLIEIKFEPFELDLEAFDGIVVSSGNGVSALKGQALRARQGFGRFLRMETSMPWPIY